MTGDELRRLLMAALPRVAEARDELRDLDAAIGDGDLGVTVGDGALAAGRGPGRPAVGRDPGRRSADGRDDPCPDESVDLLGAGHGRSARSGQGARRRAGASTSTTACGRAGPPPTPSRPAASRRSATRPSSTRWCRVSTPPRPRRTRRSPLRSSPPARAWSGPAVSSRNGGGRRGWGSGPRVTRMAARPHGCGSSKPSQPSSTEPEVARFPARCSRGEHQGRIVDARGVVRRAVALTSSTNAPPRPAGFGRGSRRMPTRRTEGRKSGAPSPQWMIRPPASRSNRWTRPGAGIARTV